MAIVHYLWAKVFKSETTFAITFPQGFRKSKKFGHWTLRSGGKKTFKRSKKIKKNYLKNFFCRNNFTPFMSKSFQIWDHFLPLLFPKDSNKLKILHIGLWDVGAKNPLKEQKTPIPKKSCSVRKNFPQNKLFCVCCDLTRFIRKCFQIWDHFFPLLFTKPSESLRTLNIRLRKWGQKTFKRYLKSEQTDKHTNRRTHGRTFQLIESIGPLVRCFENR